MRLAVRYQLSAISLALLAASTVIADEIVTTTRAKYASVRIEDIRDGALYFRDAQGRLLNRPLAEVQRITFVGWEAFNRGESALADRQYRKATREFEAALKSTEQNDPAEARPRHRRELLLVRLIASLDGEGEFDQAVRRYIELCGLWGATASGFEPRNIPGKQSALYSAAVETLKTTIDKAADGPSASLLQTYLKRIQSDTPTSAPDSQPVAVVKPKETEILLRRVEEAVESGRIDAARKVIDHAMKNEPAAKLAPWRYWNGRCLEAGAQNNDDRLRAAEEYMRVVIHFPNDPHVAESLYRTAMIHKKLGYLNRVAPLLREALSHNPGDELKRRCEQALAETATSPKP